MKSNRLQLRVDSVKGKGVMVGLIVLCLLILVSTGSALTYTAEAFKDASGYSGSWGNSGNYPYHDGQIWDGGPRQILGWAQYQLPADIVGATINSAYLEVDVFAASPDSDSDPADLGFTIRPLTVAWVEGTGYNGNTQDGVCYMSPDAPNAGGVFNWPSGYGNGSGDVVGGRGSSVVDDSGILTPRVNDYTNYDTYMIDVSNTVNAWAGGATNYGVILEPYSSSDTGKYQIMLGMDPTAEWTHVEHGTILHLDYTPVPEPATMVIFGIGSLFIASRKRA